MPTKAVSLIFICRHVQYLNYNTTTSGMIKIINFNDGKKKTTQKNKTASVNLIDGLHSCCFMNYWIGSQAVESVKINQ